MDPELARLIDLDTPKLNPIIANGLAVAQMEKVEEYVDQVFSLASKGFPEGLTYCGYHRCTPHEEFNERTRRRDNKCVFDIAPSNIFMVKYHFKYKAKGATVAEDLPDVYLYLPFVGEAGMITLGGSQFAISPVLSDRVISVGVQSIFVRLLRGKVTFKREPYQFLLDGKRDAVQVIWGAIYNRTASKRAKIKPTVKANSTLPHYLFCKYGVTETFRRYGGCEITIGGAEINRNTYPLNEYVICSSIYSNTTQKPRSVGKMHYEPSRLRIAIPRHQVTPMVKSLIGGLFYVVDLFPDRFVPTIEYLDSTDLWKRIMGHILLSGSIHEGILLGEMSDHIRSLDEYIDGPVAVKLKDIGINISDFYDLMAVMVDKFNEWIVEASDKVNSMYDKELSVLYFVLYQISSAIFNFYFKLQAAAKKELNTKEIINIFRQHLKTGLIYGIVKHNRNQVSALSYSGDNKALKITSILVPQSKLTQRKGRVSIEDPTERLHVSVAEVGGYLNIPKSEPSGRSRINPFVQIDEKGVIVRNNDFAELFDQTQRMISEMQHLQRMHVHEHETED